MMAAMSTITDYEQIAVERVDGAVTITLNRPDALNPLGVKMADEVRAAIEAAVADEESRAIVITGAGRAFSSGADLSGNDARTTPEGKPDVSHGLRNTYNPLILAVRDAPMPVIAAVNGPAAGVGCSLALACDFVVAAESSYFLMAFKNIGLTLDGGASVFLSKRIGAGRALEMALLAKKIPAAQGLEWGLCNRVVADDEVAGAAAELAAEMAGGPTLSYAASKALINGANYADLAERLEDETVRQQQMAESEDFVIGVTAFLTKQKAEFKGR